MNNLLKNKVALIVAVVVLVAAIGGGFFVLNSKSKNSEPTIASEQQDIPKMSPEEIGLSLALSSDGHKVIIRIEKTDNIKSAEYELSYMALPAVIPGVMSDGDDGGDGKVSQGALGEFEIQEGSPAEAEVVLGTCSATCRYDKDVSDVKVTLKVQKKDRKTYIVEKSLETSEE